IGDAVSLAKGATPPAPVCGDGIVNQATEQCDGLDRAACPGPCSATCTCVPLCGDGHKNPGEACDGSDDVACPGLCLSDCTCGDPSRFMTLYPAADTYIEAGVEAGWDHGAANHLDANIELPAVLTYLKFDLSPLPRPFLRATLTMSADAGSGIDGGTIYPVPDSSWIEGTCTGLDASCASGPGLKWMDVDTNADGVPKASDASPWVPHRERALRGFGLLVPGAAFSTDVTPVLQAGPGVYTLALANDFGSRSVYAARESGQSPTLRLELVPTTTTTTTT